MITQGPPGTERSAERCVSARNTLPYETRLSLARGYIAGFRLLAEAVQPVDPAAEQAQVEFYTLLHDALTGHGGRPLESVLSAYYTRSEQNKNGVCLSFPEHDGGGNVLAYPGGFMKDFSIVMQIPTDFVTAALERSPQPEHVSSLAILRKYSADPVPIPPERLRDITYSFAHRLSERWDRGQEANWLLAEQVLKQASASRTFPLP